MKYRYSLSLPRKEKQQYKTKPTTDWQAQCEGQNTAHRHSDNPSMWWSEPAYQPQSTTTTDCTSHSPAGNTVETKAFPLALGVRIGRITAHTRRKMKKHKSNDNDTSVKHITPLPNPVSRKFVSWHSSRRITRTNIHETTAKYTHKRDTFVNQRSGMEEFS